MIQIFRSQCFGNDLKQAEFFFGKENRQKYISEIWKKKKQGCCCVAPPVTGVLAALPGTVAVLITRREPN
jgi:hypothetical protein